MIYCILGHGASGKSTVQNHLKSHIPAITTYTTRPKRTKEIDGVHYHFISNENFINKLNDNFFVEHFYIKENDWFYGLSLNGLDYKNKDYTLVIEPNGYNSILKAIGNEYLRCYYINLTEHERLIRMAMRKDKIEEIFRRLIADRKDFIHFDTKADVILTSTNSKKNANVILKDIKERVHFEK